MESNKTADVSALTIIAYALMAGLALFAGVVCYLVSSDPTAYSGLPAGVVGPQADLLVVGGVGMACLVISRTLSGKLLESTPGEQKSNYPQAMGRYRTAKILRLALLEGPGILAAVFALLTGNLNMLLITLFMLAMMWTARPSEAEFSAWRGI